MAGSGGAAYRTGSVDGWATFHIPVDSSASASVREAAAPIESTGASIPTPELFVQAPGLVQPVDQRAAGTRASGEALAVSVPSELHRTVSRQQPALVDLDIQGAQLRDSYAVFPVAFDGQFSYLAGPPARVEQTGGDVRDAGRVTVQVTRLPDLSGEDTASPTAATMRFGPVRAVRLGFFKLVGIPSPDVGLRAPTLTGDTVQYRPVQAGELATGRIALLTHGFLSDTAWMVRGLLAQLRQEGYDHVIAWDYDTMVSGIGEDVDGLAHALVQAGVAPNSERVEILAHSMGCLVVRGLIDHVQSPKLVRRAVLFGPPNQGTPIALTGDRAVSLISLLLNIPVVGPVTAGAIAKFLWEHVDQGLDDLQPNSPFVQTLTQHPERQVADVHFIAGDAADDPLNTLVARVLHTGANVFYGGTNDLVVPVASMASVAHPPFPHVETTQVHCNHFDYLTNQASRQLIDSWIVG